MLPRLVTDNRARILELAYKHGAINVRVFGSMARDEATPESDVDFLVEWDMERISSWGGVGLDLELAELLGREVDVVSVEDLHWSIREQILREAAPL